MVDVDSRETLKRSADKLDDEEELLAKRVFGKTFDDTDSSDSEGSDSEADDSEGQTPAVAVTQEKSKAVWADEDDEDEDESAGVEIGKRKSALLVKRSTDTDGVVSSKEYQRRLREAFARTHNGGKAPSWATATKKKDIHAVSGSASDEDDDVEEVLDDMLRSTGKYVEKESLLPRRTIKLTHLQRFAVGQPDRSGLNVVKFHPSQPVVVTGSKGGTISLFTVDMDKKKNHFLQSAKMSKFPINSMELVQGGQTIIAGSSMQEYVMKYNLVEGVFHQMNLPKAVPRQGTAKLSVSRDGQLMAMIGYGGHVFIMHTATMEHVRTFVAPSDVQQVKWMAGSSQEIWATTVDGSVFIWELRAEGSMHRWWDDGSIRGTALAVSPHGDFIAAGSNTGFVNVYALSDCRQQQRPQPLQTFSNLTTQIDHLAFSHDAQWMTMSSAMKKSAVRGAHMRSGTVFANFPLKNETKKVGQITCCAHSPHGGYVAMGVADGDLRVYRVDHYDTY